MSFEDTAGNDSLTYIGFVGPDVVQWTDDLGNHVGALAGLVAANITSIAVICDAGNDTVNLSSAESIDGFPNLASVKLFGGFDNDTLSLPPVAAFGVTPQTGDLVAVGGQGADTVSGNDGSDRLWGDTDAPATQIGHDIDHIYGHEGDDWIYGGGANDEIYGDGGADVISGQDGNDFIRTGSTPNDDDIAHGGSGEDTIVGGMGDDQLWGGDDSDEIHGGSGEDTIYGGESAWDKLLGGPDDDIMISNENPFAPDQPFDDQTPPGNQMLGTGGGGCDVEDGHPECEGGPEAPVGEDDWYYTYPQIAVGGNVLENDWNGPPDEAELIPDTGPEVGLLTFNPDGNFTYTPPAGFGGQVSFQYIAINTLYGLESEPALVTIDVYDYESLVLDRPAKATAACGCASSDDMTSAVASPLELAMNDARVIGDAAMERWRSTGVRDGHLAAIASRLQFAVVDLPGSTLGAVDSEGRVLLDKDAAGYGWFIDVTPGSDREFQRQLSLSERQATAGSPAVSQADLLTVVMHEIGHLLGLDHADADSGNIMEGTIGLGIRRLPTALDAAAADYLFAISQEEREA